MPAAPLSPSVALMLDQAVPVCPPVQKGGIPEVPLIREVSIVSACAFFAGLHTLGTSETAEMSRV